uniref:Uncharacterized protein n=1 Tax=Oryza glumipatula TaxID=40148 RepID=A0A0E0B3Q1_9ORYZ
MEEKDERAWEFRSFLLPIGWLERVAPYTPLRHIRKLAGINNDQITNHAARQNPPTGSVTSAVRVTTHASLASSSLHSTPLLQASSRPRRCIRGEPKPRATQPDPARESPRLAVLQPIADSPIGRHGSRKPASAGAARARAAGPSRNSCFPPRPSRSAIVVPAVLVQVECEAPIDKRLTEASQAINKALEALMDKRLTDASQANNKALDAVVVAAPPAKKSEIERAM